MQDHEVVRVEVVIWLSLAEGKHLPHYHPVAPHVAGDGVLRLLQGLRGCPPDRDLLSVAGDVNIRVELTGEAEVRHLADLLLVHDYVPSGQVSVDDVLRGEVGHAVGYVGAEVQQLLERGRLLHVSEVGLECPVLAVWHHDPRVGAASVHHTADVQHIQVGQAGHYEDFLQEVSLLHLADPLLHILDRYLHLLGGGRGPFGK